MFSHKIGIDLGTCNSLVFIPKKGIVLHEPSVIAVNIQDNSILAVGKEAKKMIGRIPDAINVYRPLRDGVIADYRITQAMLRYFLKKTARKFWPFKPEVVISVPAGVTSTERRAVISAGISAGAKNCFVVKEPILAAIGAGIKINTCSGHMIVNIGGGTSEVAIISLGGIVAAKSARIAGDKMDAAIASYIKQKYSLIIGEQTAERIKIEIGTALSDRKEKFLEVKGRDLISGLPRNLKITSNEVVLAISEILREISHVIKQVLRETPPELAGDIMENNLILTGGSSLLRNIDKFITQQTGVPSVVAESPAFCVAKGTEAILENLEIYKKSMMNKK